jgi:DNA repair exonuclease SbcCD ATPase subunit
LITLQKVRWKNFLSTGNLFTEIDLNSPGKTLIAGGNGTGKTTLADAICYALFNKAFRKINKPQLVNSINAKNCVVEIEFEIGSNSYKVIRGQKPNKFEIYKNENLIPHPAVFKDYQDILENKILKLNYRTFCQIVILGSANWTPFMALSTGERRKVIEDLLEIEIFTVMNTLLKDYFSRNKDALVENANESKILTNTIMLEEKHQNDLRKRGLDTIKKHQKEISSLTSKNKSYEKDKLKVEETMQKISNALLNKNKVTDALYNIKTELFEVKRALKNINEEIEFYTNNEHCQTCDQDISEDFKKNKLFDLEEQQKSLSKLLKTFLDKKEKLDSKYVKFESVEDKFSKLNFKTAEINANINNNNIYIEKLNSEIAEIQENLAKDSVDVSSEKTKLKRLTKEKDKLLSEREIYNTAAVLLKDTGIKTQIIKQYIPVMNQLINRYLEEMDFFVKFELDENFQEKMLSMHRDNFTYDSFSQGEKMRLDLALLFTWREIAKMRNSSPVNLLLFDEIMDSSLDNSGTEEFLNILSRLTSGNNVIIISHKADQIQDKFDKILNFKKVKNFSKMVEV